jgi:multidrug efflux pump
MAKDKKTEGGDEEKKVEQNVENKAVEKVVPTPEPETSQENTEENSIGDAGIREFGLTSWAVDNSLTIFLLTFMILLFGVMAFNSIPKEQYPEVAMPTVFVNTPYPGNSAVDIENLVTRPIEKELKSLDGLKSFNSTSMQDFSIIEVEFNSDIDIDEAVIDVKDAVDKAKADLPTDMPRDPIIQDVNMSELPIVSINLSGDYSVDELRYYAEHIQDEVEKLKEISEVKIKGSVEKEMKILLDLNAMEARSISYYDIKEAIEQENVTMSAGEIVSNGFRSAVRVVGLFESAKEIENMVIKNERGAPVYIRDVGRASFDYEDRTSYARSNTLPVVSCDVVKRSGANLLAVSDKIKEIVADAEENIFPKELEVSLFNDQSIQTRNEVSNLQNSIISGVILVVVILLFFLGLRNALFVGVAIPLSMLMGILILNMMGVTMNMVVLFSLILALGMLVDNGIVVVENVYRYMQEGFSPAVAAKRGAGEVAWPIIASTATTLAAFIPLAFWPGIMGSFMKYLPITLIIVLSSSLFVALVINPVLTAAMMKVDERAEDPKVRKRKLINGLIGAAVLVGIALLGQLIGVEPLRNFMGIAAIITFANVVFLRPASFVFQGKVLPLLEKGYNKFIRFTLKGKITPLAIFASTFALLFASIALLGVFPPKMEFFPQGDPLYVNAFVEMDVGTDIEETNKIMKDMEAKVTKIMEPYESIVESVLTQIGEGTADPNGPPDPGTSPNKARLTVSFVPSAERGELSSKDAMEDIRKILVGKYPGVQVSVEKNADGPPTGKPINVELVGENLEELMKESQKIINYMNDLNIQGIEGLKADVKLAKPEQTINIDRESARLFGINTRDIAVAIRTAQYGMEVSKYKKGEDEYPINLRANEDFRNNKDALITQKITFRDRGDGKIKQVPIESVASIKRGETYTAIKRKDMDRMVTISSNILDDFNGNEIVASLEEEMLAYNLPKGMSYEFTGEQKEQAENMGFLITAFGIAMFMIFIILVTQFNSFTSPIIILLSIVLSTIGVFLGLIITGDNLVIIMTGVGIISLAGIVVNNAIVLIDFINLLIKRKREDLGLTDDQELSAGTIKNAIIEGGATRLRPVLLTAITTVLGLIPLAIGFNFNFFTLVSRLDPQVFIGGDNVAMWGPMAWTVIYGLIFATVLTLVVVPVMYWLAYKGTTSMKNILGYRKEIVG